MLVASWPHDLHPESPMSSFSGRISTLTLQVRGMACASCEARVEAALAPLPGFRSVRVDRAAERAWIDYDPALAVELQFAAAIVAAGYSATTPPSPGAPALTPPAVGSGCQGAGEPVETSRPVT